MNIGLIAHNSKKKLMQNFCIAYKGILNKNQLFATGKTKNGKIRYYDVTAPFSGAFGGLKKHWRGKL